MPNRKQIIAITVLGIVALMLGCKPNATGIGEVAGDPVEPKPNPVKPKPTSTRTLTLEEKDIVGTYDLKRGAYTYRKVFLDNGKAEIYINGHKEEEVQKWSLVDNEIHAEYIGAFVHIFKLNPDNSITHVANIIGGKRTDVPKEEQTQTFKKIK